MDGKFPAGNDKRRASTTDTEVADEDGVEVGDQIVSLVCPVGLKRIVVPGKGRECRHVQCFDLETFTKMSAKTPKWKCCVCNDAIEKSDLMVSEPFLHYLTAYPTAERCIVRTNGSHAPHVRNPVHQRRVKKPRTGSPQKQTETDPPASAIIMDLCGDEDVEVVVASVPETANIDSNAMQVDEQSKVSPAEEDVATTTTTESTTESPPQSQSVDAQLPETQESRQPTIDETPPQVPSPSTRSPSPSPSTLQNHQHGADDSHHDLLHQHHHDDDDDAHDLVSSDIATAAESHHEHP
ncbi:Zinc finger MIZ domain-containing protein 1, partial [Thoreauomyces humboldtii]